MDLMQQVTDAVASLEKNALTRLDSVDIKQRELADEILQLKQRGVHMPDDTRPRGGASVGSRVYDELKKNRELLEKTSGLRMEIKAATDLVSSAAAATVASGGVGSPGLAAMIGAQHALSQRPAGGTNTLVYSRYTGIEGGAAVQAAEGDAKAALKPTFSEITQSAITIAAHTIMSRQAMSDSAELTGAVELTLQRGLASQLDNVVMLGSVAPAWPGLLSLAPATPTAALGDANLADCATEAAMYMAGSGFAADTVILSPEEWHALQVLKMMTDEYYSGSMFGPLPTTLRGFKTIVSPTMPLGQVMVLDSRYLELLICDDLAIEVGYIDDQFTKNLATVLGELRVIPTLRAIGAARRYSLT